MLHYITAAANRSVASFEISAVQHPDLFYSSAGWRVERHYKTQNGMLVTEPRGEIWGLSMVCFPGKTMKITRFSNDDILFFCLIFPIRFLPMCTNKLLFFHEVPAFKTLWASREFSGLAVPASFRQREAFGQLPYAVGWRGNTHAFEICRPGSWVDPRSHFICPAFQHREGRSGDLGSW